MVMEINGKPWKPMEVYGYQLISIDFQGLPCMSLNTLGNDFHEYPWIHECPRISMDIHGKHWIPMEIHGNPWILMDFRGFLCIPMNIHKYPWKSMEYPWKSRWIFMDIHGSSWVSLYVYGHGYPWITMEIGWFLLIYIITSDFHGLPLIAYFFAIHLPQLYIYIYIYINIYYTQTQRLSAQGDLHASIFKPKDYLPKFSVAILAQAFSLRHKAAALVHHFDGVFARTAVDKSPRWVRDLR